jgi:hypothetical protein
LRIAQIAREGVIRLLQSVFSGSRDQVAQRGASGPNDALFEQALVCGPYAGLTPRRAAGDSGEVGEQTLPLTTVAAHKAKVTANPLKMRKAGLLVLRYSTMSIGKRPTCGASTSSTVAGTSRVSGRKWPRQRRVQTRFRALPLTRPESAQ